MRTFTLLSLCLALAAGSAGPAFAKKKPAPTAPGHYTDWNEDLDQVEIVEAFDLSSYGAVAVEPFDTSATPLPEADDNTFEPVKKVLADVATPFAEGLRSRLAGPRVEVQEPGAAPAAGTLVIRGKVEEMDPGSQAARYWAGFGAGAARTRIAGEVVDAASGKVLLRFTQERRSGAGMFGGDYVKLMNRNLRTIGEDVGAGLALF